MNMDVSLSSPRFFYPIQVIAGQLPLSSLTLGPFWFPLSALSSATRQVALFVPLVFLALAVIPLVCLPYRRKKKLQRRMHRHVSMGTIPLIAATPFSLRFISSRLSVLFSWTGLCTVALADQH